MKDINGHEPSDYKTWVSNSANVRADVTGEGDLAILKRKAKVCDILVEIAYSHFYWKDLSHKIRFPDKTIEIDPDDYKVLQREMMEHWVELNREQKK
jgi:hypothetical protein